MSVYDNMAFGLKLRKMPRAEIRNRVNEAASMLGMEGLLDRKPKQLSGGQRQRVALGRAIVREPKVFLMDEPLSNLDAKLRVQTRAELIKLHRRLGITTIYVTHDQVEAMTMGDRIAVMNLGIMQQCDTPLNLYNHPTNKFVAGFIGSPAMNFIEGRIACDNGAVYIGTGGLKLCFPDDKAARLTEGGYVGRNVTFGVRPEDIHDRALSFIGATDGNVGVLKADVIEPMGDRVLVYALSGEDTLLASLKSDTAARELTDLEVVFDMARCHVFDTETEEAVF
jgi:multiple sugar transport system ATP-binding protein